MCLPFGFHSSSSHTSTNRLQRNRRRFWSPDGQDDLPPPAYTPYHHSTVSIVDPNAPVHPPSYRYSQQFAALSTNHLSAQNSTNHLTAQSSASHLPAQPSSNHLPAQSSSHHLPTHSSTNHLSVHSSTTYLPAQPSANHPPAQSSADNLPSQYSTVYLPAQSSTYNLPAQSSTHNLPNRYSAVHLHAQSSAQNVSTQSLVHHIPAQSSQHHLPAQSSQHHLPAQSSQHNLPAQSSQHNFPAQSSQQHLPSQDSTLHLPTQHSTVHLPIPSSSALNLSSLVPDIDAEVESPSTPLPAYSVLDLTVPASPALEPSNPPVAPRQPRSRPREGRAERRVRRHSAVDLRPTQSDNPIMVHQNRPINNTGHSLVELPGSFPQAASTPALTVAPASASASKTRRRAGRSTIDLREGSHQHDRADPREFDRMSIRLNDMIEEIDGQSIFPTDSPITEDYYQSSADRTQGGISAARNLFWASSTGTPHTQSSSSSMSKVSFYSNSRLPPFLPPLKVYLPTWPLLCLAAKHSLSVYQSPTGSERADHIKSSILNRTKAMTIKSLPIDDMNIIVFAIRGTVTLFDWVTNFRLAPASPEGFLDDDGNHCHAGFLSIARSMVRPVAARLRTLLAENPGRSTSSLLITGHSAGGAVAQLLYAHMLSRSVSSDLTYLAGFFKRVHCVTFGTPPVALLPLQVTATKQNKKSLFFSIVNEGDPVTRADPAVLKSLLKLYASPAPPIRESNGRPVTYHSPGTWASEAYAYGPNWRVPNSTLSVAGRIIVMREKFDSGPKGHGEVEANIIQEEWLREVVFGDPEAHGMGLYWKRIEALATKAVTVGGIPG